MKKREISTRVNAELMRDGRIEVTNTTYSGGRIVRVQRVKFQVSAIAPLLSRLGWHAPAAKARSGGKTLMFMDESLWPQVHGRVSDKLKQALPKINAVVDSMGKFEQREEIWKQIKQEGRFNGLPVVGVVLDDEVPATSIESGRAVAMQALLDGKRVYTTGHCEHKRAPGGCPLHNLFCTYPHCDRKEIEP